MVVSTVAEKSLKTLPCRSPGLSSPGCPLSTQPTRSALASHSVKFIPLLLALVLATCIKNPYLYSHVQVKYFIGHFESPFGVPISGVTSGIQSGFMVVYQPAQEGVDHSLLCRSAPPGSVAVHTIFKRDIGKAS